MSDSLIYNGCHTLCLIDLLSLETNLSDSDIYRIRCSFARLKKGWLHDEVINSYMYMLNQESDSNLYCGSTGGMIIANNKDFSGLWFNQKLENIEKVIIPFNPTNSHWILLLLDMNNCELSILDPLGQLYEGSRNFQSCHNVAAKIFNEKFSQNKTIVVCSTNRFL